MDQKQIDELKEIARSLAVFNSTYFNELIKQGIDMNIAIKLCISLIEMQFRQSREKPSIKNLH